MKANVFKREETDGKVTVCSPQFDVQGSGYDSQEACDNFIRLLREKYPWETVNVKLVEADEE